jgi:hypothetical protein
MTDFFGPIIKQAPKPAPLPATNHKEVALTTLSPTMNIYPNTYQEAMNTTEKRNRWTAVCVEFENAKKRCLGNRVST